MTLHVALVGSDGIVLAGDKQVCTRELYWTTSVSSKIELDPTRGIAVAWAAHEVAETIAKEILKHSEMLDDIPALQQLAKETYSKALTDLGGPQPPTAELLVVSQKRIGKFIYLKVAGSQCTVRPEEEEKCFIGFRLNAACYLTERYYDKGCTVAELISLAAHTILAAGHLNPMGIKGLEIVTCTKDGIIRVPESTIKWLEQQEKDNGLEFKRRLLEVEPGSDGVK